MSTPAPTPEAPPSMPHPAIRALLFFGVLGAIVTGVVFALSEERGGGTISFDGPRTSTLDARTDTREVPGREHEFLDRADVWQIELTEGQTVTVHMCARQNSGSTPTPHLLVHGPGGASDHREEPGPPMTLPPWRRALVYTPTRTGTHSIWVYKTRNQRGYSYHLEVLHGAQPEPSGDLCALAY